MQGEKERGKIAAHCSWRRDEVVGAAHRFFLQNFIIKWNATICSRDLDAPG